MARTQQHAAESQRPTPSGDSPRKLPGDSDVETLGPPGSPAGGALFRALLAAGVDPAAAYTAVREMESMAGQSVVTQLGAQIQAGQSVVTQFGAQIQGLATNLDRVESSLAATLDRLENRLDNVENRLEHLETLKTDVATLTTDVAVLKREVRLIWAALFLAVPTLTAVLVRFFGS